MKQAITIFSIFGLAAAALADPQTGQPAPNFMAWDIFGRRVTLNACKGKIVVLESYYKGCPFCESHYTNGAMQELQKECTTNGVVWLLINETSEAPAVAKKEWADRKMAVSDWIVDADYEIARTYAMRTAPQAFVIDKNGVLAYQGAVDDLAQTHPGALPGTLDPRTAHNYVREAVRALQAGEKVAVPETKPYGCRLLYSGMPDEQMFIPPRFVPRR